MSARHYIYIRRHRHSLAILRQSCIAHWLLQLWPISLESTTHSPWKGRPFRPLLLAGLSILSVLSLQHEDFRKRAIYQRWSVKRDLFAPCVGKTMIELSHSFSFSLINDPVRFMLIKLPLGAGWVFLSSETESRVFRLIRGEIRFINYCACTRVTLASAKYMVRTYIILR